MRVSLRCLTSALIGRRGEATRVLASPLAGAPVERVVRPRRSHNTLEYSDLGADCGNRTYAMWYCKPANARRGNHQLFAGKRPSTVERELRNLVPALDIDSFVQKRFDLRDEGRPRGLARHRHVVFRFERHEFGIGYYRSQAAAFLEGNRVVVLAVHD